MTILTVRNSADRIVDNSTKRSDKLHEERTTIAFIFTDGIEL